MLTHTDLVEVMAVLDRARNLRGALTSRTRARLFAVIDNPTEETWDEAYTIIIRAESWLTLWQAVLRHTDYGVSSKPLDGTWPSIPTGEQIALALTAALEG